MKAIPTSIMALVVLAGPAAGPTEDASGETVVRVTARASEFSPREIVVERGIPVILELVSKDRDHGFNLPDFGLRADIIPGRVTRVRLTPAQAGRFQFYCDVYCCPGHEYMTGTLEVRERASVALMALVTAQLARAAVVDIATALLAIASATLLIRFRVSSAWLVLAGGLLGWARFR